MIWVNYPISSPSICLHRCLGRIVMLVCIARSYECPLLNCLSRVNRLCYVSITHVNSVSVSVYHVTFCQQTPFRDAQQWATISSLSLCSLGHFSELLSSLTLCQYYSVIISGYQFGLFTLHFNPRLCVSGYRHAQNDLYYLSHVYSMSQKFLVVIFQVLICLNQF